MTTTIKGSFYAHDSFTVRVTLASVTAANWAVSAGTQFDSVDDVLSSFNAAITSTGVSFAIVINTANHSGTIQATTAGLSFSIDWSHAGDGSEIRTFLGEVDNLTNEPSGYTFDNPLASYFYSPYGMRELSISAEPWDVQRLLTGSGQVQTNTPHHGVSDALMYSAQAVFWFGTSSTNYKPFQRLRDLIDDLLTFGQPFTITTASDSFRCFFMDTNQIDIIPQPVADVPRGDIYEFALRVLVVD